MNFKSFIFIILISFIFFGCAFKQHKSNDNLISKNYDKIPISISYDLKYFKSEERKIDLEDYYLSTFEGILRGKDIFKDIKNDSNRSENHITFKYNIQEPNTLSQFSGYLSAFTLTIIPGYISEPITLDVTIYNNDKKLKSYSYKNGISTFSWLPLILFHEGIDSFSKVHNRVVQTLLLEFLDDISKDEIFKDI